MIRAQDMAWSLSAETTSAGSVDLAAVFTTLITWVRRFVVITDAQAVAIVLWVAHTHTIGAFECTPYLQISSVMKRSGKTRLLEVLEPLTARPWLTGRTSAAALVRKVDEKCPTLLLDESDAAFNGEKEYAEALRGILNSGYRASGRATVCIGQGANIQARDFRTFCPKAIAGIGELPATIADRAIRIQLQRRTADEPCARWRERDGRAQAMPIRDELARWGTTALETLRHARPAIPHSLGDRQADVWEPLLAIADVAGGTWPIRARQAAIELSGAIEDTDTIVELLSDLHALFINNTFIGSSDLVAKLVEMDDRPWATWRRGKPLTGHSLARLLKPLGIVPKPNVAGTLRGYYRDRFEDAWSRYPPFKVSECQNTNETGHETAISKCLAIRHADSLKDAETPIHAGLSDGLTLQFAETGADDDGRV